MPNLARLRPARRPELVCWQAAENARYLVRNRQTGESFQLGAKEHFLLQRLDGRQTMEDICRAFGERFGQPLAEVDLHEFIELAARRGLLQPAIPCPLVGEGQGGGDCRVPSPPPQPSPIKGDGVQSRPSLKRKRPQWKRTASRLLRILSAVLRWPARILSPAAGRLDMLRLKHLEFVPRPDDVFIVTYPRSGTTWMQMILYQLTSDGNMDFPHIAEYCPWFERSVRSATAFETRPSPRLFKSHLPQKKMPKGPCKYIYVARNGKDVAVSYYHLSRMYNGFEGTFHEFLDRFLRGKVEFGSWFEHVRGWHAHRDDPNVLFLTYEELSRDLEGCIRRIAAFIGQDAEEGKLSRIVDRCRFDFMKEYEQQFDPVMESLWEQGVQLKSFLRNGRVGDGAVSLTKEQQARFDEEFHKQLRHLGVPLS